jgi:hypothetical protein
MNRYIVTATAATACLWLIALQHLANLPGPSSTYITTPTNNSNNTSSTYKHPSPSTYQPLPD